MIMGGRAFLDSFAYIDTKYIEYFVDVQYIPSIILICIYIYTYSIHIVFFTKIQCNLLVGFNGKGFMPWAKTDRLWRSCCPLQPNNPGCDTGRFLAGVAGREASGYYMNG